MKYIIAFFLITLVPTINSDSNIHGLRDSLSKLNKSILDYQKINESLVEEIEYSGMLSEASITSAVKKLDAINGNNTNVDIPHKVSEDGWEFLPSDNSKVDGRMAINIPYSEYEEVFYGNGLSPAQKLMIGLKPHKKNDKPKKLLVTAWVNRENNTYRIGESIKFFVRVNRDAYITMLNIGTSGKSHVIFPNSYQQNNFIMAGEVLQLPHPNHGAFDLQAYGPVGLDTTKIIATIEDVNPISRHFTERAGKYRVVTKDLKVVVNKADKILNSSSNPVTWDEYTTVIKIKN